MSKFDELSRLSADQANCMGLNMQSGLSNTRGLSWGQASHAGWASQANLCVIEQNIIVKLLFIYYFQNLYEPNIRLRMTHLFRSMYRSENKYSYFITYLFWALREPYYIPLTTSNIINSFTSQSKTKWSN